MTETDVFSVVMPDVPVVDVVFLHGLGGDARATWMNGEAFWPDWLGQDVPGVAVWSVGYAASPSGWLGRAMPIQDRAVNVLAALQNVGVGERPLVFVTHSMGGLLAKQMLRHADSSSTFASFAAMARGVVFLATPHTGADMAKVLTGLKTVLRTTAAGKDLARNAAHLRDLNVWYRHWVFKTGIVSLAFFEANKTLSVQVVDAGSADPGVAGADPIAIDADHFTISKPAGRGSVVYGQVQRFLTGIRDTTPPSTTTRAASTTRPPRPGDTATGYLDASQLEGSQHAILADVPPAESALFVVRGEELRRLDTPEPHPPYLADAAPLNQILSELDGLVGLVEVKNAVRGFVALAELRRLQPNGRGRPVAPHLLFVGPPGTGKTIVAGLTGRVLAEVGLLAKGHLVVASRRDLVAGYVGQTAIKTRETALKALDGVLYIDEAYALGQANDFGQEAATELVAIMEEYRGRLVVIAGGYAELMEGFLRLNEGLDSQFGERWIFPEFTSAELCQNFEQLAQARGYQLAAGTLARAAQWLEELRERAESQGLEFGNARAVRDLFSRTERRFAARIMRLPIVELAAAVHTIEAVDVPDSDTS
ncbi:AAA family ATPase [Amycolatopsis sp. EV170708-02-1]|uniref:AAA family ATPase n=1 Tax=Amycolatopsis sp. EV170708-02-1 TaxID=2919322 RepID=UPI001F0C43D3|nr:AAA family ATPase [Amycolatopsis sp. EV170708-02-1]UMP07136.1 AAA family ATPase [Amycolatopsis sp. EV170708-02-1]